MRPALVEIQRRRTVSTARIDGAIAGTPFFIALVPAYLAFLQQEVRLHLRVAALYGHDLTDPHVAADFLGLRGVHQTLSRRSRSSPSSVALVMASIAIPLALIASTVLGG